MKIKVSGTPKEIKKLLDAIRGSREQLAAVDKKWLEKNFKHPNHF